jgi:hypothetical protein
MTGADTMFADRGREATPKPPWPIPLIDFID